MFRFPLGLAAGVGVVLIAAGAVLADNPTKEKIARTAAGNVEAKREVLRHADLGNGWSGGFVKPDLPATLPCSYHPKQSDLVLIGAAETTWDKSVIYEVDSEAEVLRTAAMVGRDWQRSVLARQVLPCLREAFKKALGSKAKVISAGRVAFPHLTTYTRAFRFRARLNSPNGTVPIESDFVVLGAGRNEMSLTLTGFAAARASLRADTLRLARGLGHRMQS
ncbi:MAG: hypothetical protein ACXVQQ_05220 [Gaiellaceae bacterium]